MLRRDKKCFFGTLVFVMISNGRSEDVCVDVTLYCSVKAVSNERVTGVREELKMSEDFNRLLTVKKYYVLSE